MKIVAAGVFIFLGGVVVIEAILILFGIYHPSATLVAEEAFIGAGLGLTNAGLSLLDD